MNLPNKITLVRILLIPLFVVLFLVQFPFHYLAACIVFIVASITDFIDGNIARRRNLVTNLGKFLDPFALNQSSCDLTIETLRVCCQTYLSYLNYFHHINE